MHDRRRNFLILLIVAGLIAGSLAVIATKKTRLGLDLKGGVELVYQGKPTAQSKVDTESLNRAIDIMRKRVDQLGVSQPEIQRSGEREIDVALPNVSNSQRAEQEVGKTAQLYFYDWEPNVIGPAGTPAQPGESTVTGGAQAGASQFGLPEYQAALRGPEESKKNLYADYKVPAGAKTEAVRVNPGTVLAQARAVESASGKVTNKSPNSYYVLNDDPVLNGSDVT